MLLKWESLWSNSGFHWIGWWVSCLFVWLFVCLFVCLRRCNHSQIGHQRGVLEEQDGCCNGSQLQSRAKTDTRRQSQSMVNPQIMQEDHALNKVFKHKKFPDGTVEYEVGEDGEFVRQAHPRWRLIFIQGIIDQIVGMVLHKHVTNGFVGAFQADSMSILKLFQERWKSCQQWQDSMAPFNVSVTISWHLSQIVTWVDRLQVLGGSSWGWTAGEDETPQWLQDLTVTMHGIDTMLNQDESDWYWYVHVRKKVLSCTGSCACWKACGSSTLKSWGKYDSMAGTALLAARTAILNTKNASDEFWSARCALAVLWTVWTSACTDKPAMEHVKHVLYGPLG